MTKRLNNSLLGKRISVSKRNSPIEDEQGSMTVFIMLVFTSMIAIAGFAVDVARYEASRSEIQAHLDNATLAAASLNQSSSPEEVFNSYMQVHGMAEKYNLVYDKVAEVDLDKFRSATATASLNMETFFMKMMGVHNLDVAVASTASERVPQLEVSLVLDISGSMNNSGRLTALKPAAQQFVATLLGFNDADNPNRVAINLIPYNMQVNAGKAVFEAAYGGDADHDWDYCAEWSNDAFDETGFSGDKMVQAMPMDWSNGNWSTNNAVLSNPKCSTRSSAIIAPFSNNVGALQAQIGGLVAGGNTSIDIAAKWAVSLLDPNAAGPMINSLSSKWEIDPDTQTPLLDELGNEQFDDDGNLIMDPDSGELVATDPQAVDPGFAGRPVAFGDTVTQKIMVLMTDGRNTTETRVRPNYADPDGLSGVYWHIADERISFSDKSYNAAYRALKWPETWAKVPLRTYMNNMPGSNSSSTYWDSSLGNTAKNTRLQAICNKAKENNNILVFTISYSATADGISQLQQCATDLSYAKAASPGIIDQVFEEIVADIQKLKLTN